MADPIRNFMLLLIQAQHFKNPNRQIAKILGVIYGLAPFPNEVEHNLSDELILFIIYIEKAYQTSHFEIRKHLEEIIMHNTNTFTNEKIDFASVFPTFCKKIREEESEKLQEKHSTEITNILRSTLIRALSIKFGNISSDDLSYLNKINNNDQLNELIDLTVSSHSENEILSTIRTICQTNR